MRRGWCTTTQPVGLSQIIDPVGLTTSFRYANGRVSEIEDPAGRITRLSHNQGNLVGVQDPDGTQRHFEYDMQHRLVAEIDKRGNRERVDYDFAGRVGAVHRKDGTRVHYDPVQTQGLLPPESTREFDQPPLANTLDKTAIASVADANGNVRHHELDKQGTVAQAPQTERGTCFHLAETTRTSRSGWRTGAATSHCCSTTIGENITSVFGSCVQG